MHLGPLMYFDRKIGIINFIAYMPVTVIIMSSLDTPASINFKFDGPSIAENPNYYIIHIIILILMYTKNIKTYFYETE